MPGLAPLPSQVLQLIEFNIGVGVVDQRVEKVQRFEDGHRPLLEVEVLGSLLLLSL